MRLLPPIRLLLCLLLLTPDDTRAGGVFTVNTSAWNNSRDGQLSLLEASLLGGGQIQCVTDAERNQSSGCNWIVTPPSPSCAYNPFDETRWQLDELNATCGVGSADDIEFASGITSINPGGSVELWRDDDLDGSLSGGGRVHLIGPGAGGWAGAAIKLRIEPVSTGSQIRFLEISNYNGHGIWLRAANGAILEALRIHDNLGHGILLGDNPFSSDERIDNVRVGSLDGTRPNHLYDNSGSGIRVVDQDSDGSNRLLRIVGNFIGFRPGDSTDHGNGQHGIELINSPGSRIGGFIDNGRNYIGWNGQAGILVNGGNSKFNVIARNWIGQSSGGVAAPNRVGLRLENGAHDNTIGDETDNAERNVLVNSLEHGLIGFDCDSNLIARNTIGINAVQNQVHANGIDGIALNAGCDANRIIANIIAGNGAWGIYLGGTTGTIVRGNAIGLRGLGSSANDVTIAGNASGGIWVNDGHGAVIELGNLIAGNGGHGIQISDGNTITGQILGNRIGLDGAGNSKANSGDGIHVQGGGDSLVIGSTSARNVISGNGGDGIDVDGSSSDVSIIGNWIGTDPTGNADRGNAGHGALLRNGVTQSLVQANLISGNSQDGLKLEGVVNQVDVLGNTVGLNLAQSAAIGNTWSGIALVDGASSNRIGSSGSANRNVIAGNDNGIYLSGTGTLGNRIENNQVGWEGTLALPTPIGNSGAGIFIGGGADNTEVLGNAIVRSGSSGLEISAADNCVIENNRIGIGLTPFIGAAHPNARGIRMTAGASGCVIGGAVAASERNVISGNSSEGIGLFNTGTQSNIILNNYIGTDFLGTSAVGNGTQGILIQETASNSTVTSNLISGNGGDGVWLRHSGTSGNNIQRNLIGTDANGTGVLGNVGAGIHIDQNASANAIGFLPGQGNTIRFNQGDGIWIESGLNNSTSFNMIAGNGGLGIDLGGNGVTPNDAAPDSDTGANGLLNFPTLGNIARAAGSISFTANLVSAGGGSYGLQFWHNQACDPSGHGEAETVLGDGGLNLPAGGSGSANFMLPLADAVPATWLTAMTAQGDNTSELSPCALIGLPPAEVFKDGFEQAVVATATHKDLGLALPGWTLARVNATEVVATYVDEQRTNTRRPAFAIRSDRGVAVLSIVAEGAACALHGAVVCEPAGTGPIRIALRITRPAGEALTLEQLELPSARVLTRFTVPAAPLR